MPFIIIAHSAGAGGVNANSTTSSSINTELDQGSANFSSTSLNRSMFVTAVYGLGTNAGLTTISGIAYRLKRWTTTGSTGGGNGVNNGKVDPLEGLNFPSYMEVLMAVTGSTALTSGTGGPNFIGGWTSGATGPGGWTSSNTSSWLELDSRTGGSIDLFSVSGTASMTYEQEWYLAI